MSSVPGVILKRAGHHIETSEAFYLAFSSMGEAARVGAVFCDSAASLWVPDLSRWLQDVTSVAVRIAVDSCR